METKEFTRKELFDLVWSTSLSNLDRNTILRLAECEFVEKNENILITGSTGVGKSYLGTALGYQTCIQGFKVSYFNTSKLFTKLKMAKQMVLTCVNLPKLKGKTSSYLTILDSKHWIVTTELHF